MGLFSFFVSYVNKPSAYIFLNLIYTIEIGSQEYSLISFQMKLNWLVQETSYSEWAKDSFKYFS
jgi:hypothetical protein